MPDDSHDSYQLPTQRPTIPARYKVLPPPPPPAASSNGKRKRSEEPNDNQPAKHSSKKARGDDQAPFAIYDSDDDLEIL